ncbi:TolC family protein [Pseudohongiella sp. SYSU M77423]|uniref:TolC family protein n=1 Tax=Pseudohongiella sp. SYSU M77423 TaxID=3042312 RepID=UPI0024814396|nr:TolC family protein [Pseudohongiella sp. SYSU M77423]MDH7945147.1 TolC family protein [Pseudohongiella sp. SYSU M77423]
MRAQKIVITSAVSTALLLISALSLAAEEITLEQAIINTITQNPELQAFGYELRAQDGVILQAGLSPKPELTVTVEDVLGTGVAQALSGAQTTASISWVLEGKLRQRRIDAARTGSLVLASEAEVMRLDAAAQTARYYTQALAHQARLQLAEQSIALAEDSVSTIGQRVDAGTAPRSDLARARAELSMRELMEEDLHHELVGFYHRIAAQWGMLEPDFSRVQGDLTNLPAVEAYPALEARIEQNPDLTRFLSEQRLHESTLLLEQAKRNSLWRFNAGVRRIESSSDVGFVAGVTIPLNRGNQNQGRIEEARVRLEQASVNQEAERIRMKLSLFLFYQELEHSLHIVESLRSDVIPEYELALSEVRRAYELGSSSYMEWLQVQNDLLAAREQLLEASVLAHQNMIEIERLTGVRIAQSASEQ